MNAQKMRLSLHLQNIACDRGLGLSFSLSLSVRVCVCFTRSVSQTLCVAHAPARSALLVILKGSDIFVA